MRKLFLKIVRPFYELAKKNNLSAWMMFSALGAYNNFVSRKYNKIPLAKTEYLDFTSGNKSDLCLVTIAFNNEKLIELQIVKMKEFLLDGYNLVIADNSNVPEKSLLIKEVCKKHQTTYIRLPKNPWHQANLSHGVTLNWMYNNYILSLQPEIFGFLDHDIFLNHSASIKDKFLGDKLMYGHLQPRELASGRKFWYLWAGFCFYKSDYLLHKEINFSSVVVSRPNYFAELDSGGGNYVGVYAKTDISKVASAQFNIGEYGEEHIDEWVHISKASFKSSDIIDKIINKVI